MDLILDTSALLDILFVGRPQHEAGQKVFDFIRARKVNVRVPMHLLFEVECMMMHQFQTRGTQPKSSNRITEERPLEFQAVPIDINFVNTYRNPDLPYVKAGDFIFLAMAAKEGATLLTCDRKLRKAARKTGLAVYTLSEFALAIEAGLEGMYPAFSDGPDGSPIVEVRRDRFVIEGGEYEWFVIAKSDIYRGAVVRGGRQVSLTCRFSREAAIEFGKQFADGGLAEGLDLWSSQMIERFKRDPEGKQVRESLRLQSEAAQKAKARARDV